MAQCKKHGHYACPHCLDEKKESEPTLSPYFRNYEETRQSERDSYNQYSRKIGLIN